MTDPELMALAARLADAAGGLTLEIRGRGLVVSQKQDKSPVTEADRQAEALILAGLREATPEIPVIAEEEVAAGRVPPLSATFWLVDPLDGTREFAAGRTDFTVNVGLVRSGRSALGAVAAPAYGMVYCGIVGVGAWRCQQGGKQRIYVRAQPAEGIDVVASYHYRNDPQLPEFLKGRKVRSVSHMGSAVKFCRLAEGAADLYPRFGRTMEWDTAAPQAVLEAAGGTVRGFDGAPLSYGKPGWENPPFLCQGG